MKKKKMTKAISTFQGVDSNIEGNIEFEGTIRIDGGVRGKISSNGGTVVVGEKAVIHAEIHVDVAVIMGKVFGVVNARDRIELYPPGQISGDIQAPVVSMEAGVIFEGNCRMGSPEAQKPHAIDGEPPHENEKKKQKN